LPPVLKAAVERHRAAMIVPIGPVGAVAPPPMPTLAAQAQRLEQVIGLKWTGWVGAIVLVVGAALGIKFAYDNHWFGAVPPAIRLGVIVAAGLALIGAGEYVLRRVHQVPAASLFGAGVATLFVGAYAGYAYLELYSRSTSMTLMGASTLVGAAVAMRGNLVSIATLSLLGANLAPLLVATPDAPLVPFLFYLLMMQTVALILTSWGRGGKWWTLRGLSLGPTVVWMGAVLAGEHAHETAVLAFMLIYAALYHTELALTTWRHAPREIAADSSAAATSSDAVTPAHLAVRTAGTAFVICVTAALTLGVLNYFVDASRELRTTWVLALAAFSGLLGFGFPALHRALKPLGLSHRVAGAALLVLAAPIATSGIRLEVAWAILAVGFALNWALTGSRVARYAAPITWLLGLMRLANGALSHDGLFHPGATWLTVWGTAIGSTVILACILAIAGQLIAALLIVRPRQVAEDQAAPRWLGAVQMLGALAGLAWIAAAIGGLPHLGATLWIVVYAWLLIAADRFSPRLKLAVQAGGVLLVATVKWADIDTLAARLSPTWLTTRPVFNSLMGTGLLVAASLVGYYHACKQSLLRAWIGHDAEAERRSNWALGLTSIVIIVLTLGLSFEVDRLVLVAAAHGLPRGMSSLQVCQLGFTILWSAAVAALFLIAALLATKQLRARWMGWLWLLGALLAAKFFIVDTLLPLVEPRASVLPLLNLQVLAGLAVIAALAVARASMPAGQEHHQALRHVRWRIGLLATLLIAWMGTLEIDRAIARLSWSAASPGLAWHDRNLAWTIWWCVVAAGALAIWWWADQDVVASARAERAEGFDEPWLLLPGALTLIAAKYLIWDAFTWRLMHEPAGAQLVVANFDFLAAVVVIVGLLVPSLLARWANIMSGRVSGYRRAATGLIVLVLLVAGTLEVDRAFHLPSLRSTLHDATLAEQVGLSIFWSSFAVTALAIGFWRRLAPLRYFALTLLALTLLKVVVVDLSSIGYGYRVLSFLGLGLLLLSTSVMYGKVSPKLLRSADGAR
jgi:uncharacterized membrane protein